MELVTASDLVVTASLALLLSLLLAKLVSMAMAADPQSQNTHQQQPVIDLKQELLSVQKPQTETRVEFLGPIQVSTSVVETEQNREEVEEEITIESNIVKVSSNEVEVCNVGVLREEHVAEDEEGDEEEEIKAESNDEKVSANDVSASNIASLRDGHVAEEEVLTEINEKREELGPHVVEDCEEQNKTESLEDCEEQRKTESSQNYVEQRKTECAESCEEQRKTEEFTMERFNDDDDGDDDGNDDDDDDDWEGIERSELEKEFMSATEFVGGGDGLGSDVMMELYGLHKVATEGPCREPQPMPLKISARAKWYQFLFLIKIFLTTFIYFI